MNSSPKFLFALAGVLLLSVALSSTWMTTRAATYEIPPVGFDDLFNRLHPEWHVRPSRHWPSCFGLCPEPFL